MKTSAVRRLLWACAAMCIAVSLPAAVSAKKKPDASGAANQSVSQSQAADEDSQAGRGNSPAAESVRDHDDPRARAKYLETRRSGGQPVPRGARLRAMREQQQMMINEGKAFWDGTSTAPATGVGVERTGAVPQRHLATPESSSAPPPLSSSQWVFIGPQPTNPTTNSGGAHVSGRVTALAVDPGDTTGNTVYLGAAQGGIWKTTNGGTSWTPLTDNQDSLATGSIVVDPQVNAKGFHTVYVGTGEENFGSDSYYGVGILKSLDGGATWTLISGTTVTGIIEPECNGISTGVPGLGSGCGGLKIGSLAMSNGVLLAAVEAGFSNTGGLYRSTDGGGTWSRVTGIGTGGYTADSVVFVSSTLAYAGIHRQGIFKSTDSGATWSAFNPGVTLTNIARVSLSAATDGSVYAALENEGTQLNPRSILSGLYKLSSPFTTWVPLSPPADFCGANGAEQCFYDMLVAVDPHNSSDVFIGGSGFPNTTFLFHSVNGGTNWFQDTTNIHADQHAGAFSPDGSTFYIGNDGGAYKTTSIGSGSVTWTELNTTLGITQFYSNFVIDLNNSQLTYAGTQDNGSQRFSGDMFWDEITCGDGAGAVIDSNSGRVFANCNDIDVRESADGTPGSFGSQHQANGGIPPSDIVAFIPPMIGDKSNPQRLYFGTNQIYQATSAISPAWSSISQVLTSGGTDSFLNVITNMDVSSDGNTMYVVTGDGHVSKGTSLLTAPSFTDVTGANQFPSGAFLSAVRISPSDVNTAYLALPGFTVGKHIYKTTTGGVNWTDITNNLPNTPVNDLVIDPDLPSTLYAATDVGVFVSNNDGGSWTTLQSVLPKVAVLGLRLQRNSRILRAATHGRGMWDLSVPACGAGPCPVFSPQGLNFGNQAVATSSATQNLTLTNNGASSLTVFAITPSGDYSQTNNCPATLATNASCTITVTFTPTQGLARNGNISLMSNVGHVTLASLNGTGIVVPSNDDVNSSMTITSLPFTATVITNGATTAASDPIPPLMNPSEILTPNPGANDSFDNCVGVYDTSDPLGYATAPSFNHHSIWFNYTPQADGNVDIDTLQSQGIDTVISVWTGQFTAVPNGCNDDKNSGVVRQSQLLNLPVTAGTTYRIMVSGYYAADAGAVTFHIAQSQGSGVSGAPFILSSSAMNFAAVLNRSISQSIAITNTSGSARTISSLAVTGAFTLSHNCPLTINGFANGVNCTATVTFAPSVVGQQNGLLTITDSASGSPQTIPLTGIGFNLTLNQRRASRPARGSGVIPGQVERFQLSLDTSTGGASIPVSLSCADVPPGATCTVTPAQINAGDGSVPVTVTLQTSAASTAAKSSRVRRLTADVVPAATPIGSYNLRVVARAGDAETSTIIPVTVAAPARASRISH